MLDGEEQLALARPADELSGGCFARLATLGQRPIREGALAQQVGAQNGLAAGLLQHGVGNGVQFLDTGREEAHDGVDGSQRAFPGAHRLLDGGSDSWSQRLQQRREVDTQLVAQLREPRGTVGVVEHRGERSCSRHVTSVAESRITD